MELIRNFCMEISIDLPRSIRGKKPYGENVSYSLQGCINDSDLYSGRKVRIEQLQPRHDSNALFLVSSDSCKDNAFTKFSRV